MLTRIAVPLTLCVQIFIGFTSTAQVHFGFKAGPHMSTAYVKTPEGNKPPVNSGLGFHIGAEARVPFEGNLFFLPQFQYAYKTFEVEYHTADTQSKKLYMHYIEIPLLLDYETNAGGKGWTFQFGPSFSVAINGKQEIVNNAGTGDKSDVKFAFDAYGRFEANAVANVGYRFANHLAVTVGYSLGMGSIVDDDYGPVIKPRMATLSMHYWLKKK
jgi:Outer membrane protein beta-barrel domain